MSRKLCILLSATLMAALGASAQQRIASRPSGNGNTRAAAATSSSSDRKSNSKSDRKIWDEAITKISCWQVSDPLGIRTQVPVDTIWENYCQSVAIPSMQYGIPSAITGNLGTEGMSMNYFERPTGGDFFFNDALSAYLPSVTKTRFYNNRVPMTLLSYNTGGSSETAQDWLKAVFNGNINKRAQVGAFVDFLYSKGMYEAQAAKHFIWGLNGSYLGDRYQVMAQFNQYNSLNKENGGIQDDLYILDPAEIQGGNTSVNTKQIPTNLANAHSRVWGKQLWVNNRYRFGFSREEADSTVSFVPVSQLFWTLDYTQDTHRFIDKGEKDNEFFRDTHFSTSATDDRTKQWTLRNTVGASLLEGFNKYAQAGLTAFVTHEVSRYTQQPIEYQYGVPDLSGIRHKVTENSLSVGARIAKEQGRTIHYSGQGSIALVGTKLGDLSLRGDADLNVRIRRDTVRVDAYVDFSNKLPSFFLREYVSNHFIWHNDFGKTRRLRFGGALTIPHSDTRISAGMENVQNLVYFNSEGFPVQYGGNVQILNVDLKQNLSFGIWNWDNTVTFQQSTNDAIISLPQLSVYSNMYLKFRVATLSVQLGVDCAYTTRYHAPGYQPATMSFTNSREMLIGNYPMMDAYLNMKLSKVRFFVLCSHFNQGLFGGSNFFSALHYPLNPRRFLFGLSIDFAN